MAIKNKWKTHNTIIDHEMGIVEYIGLFIRKIHAHVEQTKDQKEVPNCIVCWVNNYYDNVIEYSSFIYSKDIRKGLIKKGENYAEEFLKG